MLIRKRIDVDFCVIGGGLSGMCAAIAAAREGAKVALVHERPVLGGNASSEIRMWVCGSDGENNRETGIIEEIALENYYRNPTKNYYIWDTVLYDFVIREKNIELLLNCTCMDAETRSGEFAYGRDREISKVTCYQMTTQTFYDIYAKNYADCSGDSILAPLTGAEFRLGRESKNEFGEPSHVEEPDSLTMGMSCILQGRETTEKIKFTAPEWSTKIPEEYIEGRGFNVYDTGDNFWYLELGGKQDTIHDTEEIARDLIPLAVGSWDLIKNSGRYNADNWELDFLGFLPGKRESRRMVGEYIINANDIIGNTKFEDTVAYGGWPIDDHYPDGFYTEGRMNFSMYPDAPYCIPYRSLYSKNVSNLFFAGRNISMTHMAMSTIRVMATCAVMGQAVGTAAALAAKYSLTPHGIYEEKLGELQNILMENDCLVPTRTREVSKLCLKTPIIGGDDTLKNGQDRPNKIYGDTHCGVTVRNGGALEYRFERAEKVSSVHVTFNSDLDRKTLPGDHNECRHTMRANVPLGAPQTYVPKTLCRSFILEADTPYGKKEILSTDRNLNRAYHVELNEEILALRLIPLSNWGDTDETDVFSFDFK